MKKIAVLMMTVIFTLALCSCGGPSPAEVADAELQYLQTATMDEMAEASGVDVEELTGGMADSGYAKFDESFSTYMTDTFFPKIQEFEYELGEETINEEKTKAEVAVTITTYDMGGAMNNAMNRFYDEAMEMAMSGASEESMMLKFIDLLEEETASAEKTFTDEVAMTLIKNDEGNWEYSKKGQSSEFLNAVLGGAVEGASNFE